MLSQPSSKSAQPTLRRMQQTTLSTVSAAPPSTPPSLPDGPAYVSLLLSLGENTAAGELSCSSGAERGQPKVLEAIDSLLSALHLQQALAIQVSGKTQQPAGSTAPVRLYRTGKVQQGSSGRSSSYRTGIESQSAPLLYLAPAHLIHAVIELLVHCVPVQAQYQTSLTPA